MKFSIVGIYIYVAVVTAAFATPIDIYMPTGSKGTCHAPIENLLQKAYKHYPSIKASEKIILSAQSQIEGAKWNYFPTPSVDFSQGDAGRRGQTYRIDQPLWTGGKLDALSELAYARGDEAKYSLEESAYALTQLVLDIVQSLIQADGEIKAFEKGKKDLEGLSQMLERRVEAGVSSEADQELVSARMFQIEGDILIAKHRYDTAKKQLSLIIGKPLKCGLRFKGDSILKPKYRYPSVAKKMLMTHPTLKKMNAQVAIASAEKHSADASVMPNVSLRAEHQRGSIYTNDPVNNETVAYVAISFNPGAGLSSFSNMESAKYKVLQAKDERMVKEQELKNALMNDYNAYLSTSMRLESMMQTIAASRKVMASYKRLFLAGKRQWLDLVNSSREVTQNLVQLAAFRATLITANYRLALQQGDMDFEFQGLK